MWENIPSFDSAFGLGSRVLLVQVVLGLVWGSGFILLVGLQHFCRIYFPEFVGFVIFGI